MGYLVLPNFLPPDQVGELASAVDALELHALAHVDKPPRKTGVRGPDYHINDELGYHVQGGKAEGKT